MAWSEDQNSPPPSERHNRRSNNGWIAFLVLFLLAAGMLAYYQFYQGNGKWRFTLMHKSNDTTFLSNLKNNVPPAANKSSDTINHGVSDTTQNQNDTMHHINTSVKTPENMAQDKPRRLKPVEVDEEPLTGTVYEVQIGTIENYDLKKYNAIFNNLHEEKEGKLTKLTLGRFQTLSQANAFRKDMLKLGLKDAWVVKKVNGERVK
jgi:hypothetical protein